MNYSLTAVVRARPDDVWKFFLDMERWPEMTPSIREVRRLDRGALQVGSEAFVSQPRLPTVRWRVTELTPGHSFMWQTSSAGVTTIGEHIVELKDEGAIITLTLRQRGFLAGVVDVLLGGLTRKYLAMELEGFRRAAESTMDRS